MGKHQQVWLPTVPQALVDALQLSEVRHQELVKPRRKP